MADFVVSVAFLRNPLALRIIGRCERDNQGGHLGNVRLRTFPSSIRKLANVYSRVSRKRHGAAYARF